MYKRILVGIGIAGILIFSGGVLAHPTSALTIDEIQSQIKELLAKIAELTGQLNTLRSQSDSTQTAPTTVVDPTGNVPRHRICSVLYRNLSRGVSGDDVHGLQEFLKDEGHLSANATGYFGPLTAQALARWQASEGIESVGVAGPITRERIKVWCGGVGGVNEHRFAVSPTRGEAPLTVTFSTWLSGFRVPNISYVIDFGDGASERAADCYAPADACLSPGVNMHTYRTNGTYTATLTEINDLCRGVVGCAAPVSSRVVGKAQVYVGTSATCTKEYKPVCGSKQVVCITTPCNPIQQTYSNRCMMEADGATFLYEGQCRTTSTDPSANPRCRAWYDGCNNCSRENPNGPAVCTLRACIWQAPAYCTAYFDDAVNEPPIISEYSGPTKLEVNQTGTWTIDASDPENGRLSYQILWGDETQYVPLSSSASAAREFVQTSTFTHAYRFRGIYAITVIVRDGEGQEARAGTTVSVGEDPVACTFESRPVCGQPPEPACRHSIPACMMATPGPQTYSNRCIMNAAGATFLYEGVCRDYPVACTADAMLCRDGSYVGRTGTNCAFVCPGSAGSSGSCTTPWGSKVVVDGETAAYQPYFSGGIHTATTVLPRMRCSAGTWLQCDWQGSNCHTYP